MLNNTREFIAGELLARLYQECNPHSLMEESAVEVERKREMLGIYNSLKEAVKIVGDINVSTHTTPTPAPVDYNWINESAPTNNAPVRSSRGAPPPPRPPPTRPSGNDPFAELRSITAGSGWSNQPPPAVPNRASPAMGRTSDNRPPPQTPRRPGQQPPTIPSRPSNY